MQVDWKYLGKGLRTVAVGLIIAILPSALTYIAGIDWTSFGLSPSAGLVIGTVVIALRSITNTPIGSQVPKPS